MEACPRGQPGPWEACVHVSAVSSSSCVVLTGQCPTAHPWRDPYSFPNSVLCGFCQHLFRALWKRFFLLVTWKHPTVCQAFWPDGNTRRHFQLAAMRAAFGVRSPAHGPLTDAHSVAVQPQAPAESHPPQACCAFCGGHEQNGPETSILGILSTCSDPDPASGSPQVRERQAGGQLL